MNYKWTPSETLEGFVEIKLLKYNDRMKVLESLNLKPNKEGEVTVNKDTIDQLSKIRERLVDQITKVDLKHKDSGLHFKSLDDLEYYEEYQEVVNSLSGILLNGVKLGNGSKKR